MATDKNKGGGLDKVIASLEKKFGRGTIMTLTGDAVQHVEVFSTGSIGLDLALGVRGLPFGRIIEIYGPESSGKTTLTLHAIAEAQRLGHIAAFIDAEHALDPGYATQLGVDLERLVISQPSSGEEGLEIAEALARSGEIGLIVIDSVAALTPRAEIEGDMGDSHVGLQARLMGQALRKLTAAANQTGTSIIFINQLRQKIGVMFGSNETTTGGNALKFYASVRLDIRRISTLKDSDGKPYGVRARVKVVKNKVAPPMQQTEFDVLFGRGICQAGEILDLAVGQGVVEKSGAWISFEGERVGQGRERARQALIENLELFERVRDGVLSQTEPEEAVVEGELELEAA